MLDAACAGEVFTSPVPDQIVIATKAVNGGAGVLHIVKNYTGDVLNFQMAAELAGDEGYRGRLGRGQRRRRRAGLALHGGPPRRRRDRLRREDRRRAGRARRTPRRGGRGGGRGERAEPVVRRRADLVHGAGRRQAHVRPAGARRSSSASASTASPAAPGRRCSPHATSWRSRWTPSTPTCRSQGDLLVMVNGMGGTPLIELYGAAQRGQPLRRRPRRPDRPQPGGQLHHQPGNAGLLRDRVPPHRRADRGCGTRRWRPPGCAGDGRPGAGTADPFGIIQIFMPNGYVLRVGRSGGDARG